MAKFFECENFKKLKNIKHGFFSSKGGVSTGVFSSLNCSYKEGDEEKNVLENRKIVEKTLNVKNLITVVQTHSVDVTVLEKNWSIKDRPLTDAIVTNKQNVSLKDIHLSFWPTDLPPP
jgi:copper oxidase (laccase) domain-containing protein